MNPLRAINEAAMLAPNAAKAREYIFIAKYFAAAHGDLPLALASARANRALPSIEATLKSAVAAGTLDDSTWAAPLAEYSAAIAAFIDSLRNVGAFDAMLPSMRNIPLRTRAAVVAVGASAATLGAGEVTPISSLQLDGKRLDERKAVALICVTDELLKQVSAASAQLFGRELRNAVASETDEQFISLITDGISPIASSGTTAGAVRTDFAAALDAIDTDRASQLFVLIESAQAKKLAVMGGESGASFPAMTPQGGILLGMPALVTDGLPSGTIAVVDANQIAAGAGTIELDSSNQTSLQFQSAPDSPPSATSIFESLWQTNRTALKAVRYFGAERMRDTAVALISGVNYTGGNSPS